MNASTKNGILQRSAVGSVDEVVERPLSILRAKATTVFAVVDHSGEAEKVGLQMPDTKLVVFGSPKAGTPLMLAESSSALDLPLKVLIAEGTDGITRISYNSLAYLQNRRGLSAETVQNVAGIDDIVGALVQ